MARPTNTLKRRGELADALLRIMASRGYEGATVGAIAREARLAPGIVHYHFKDKREILLEGMERLSRILQERFERRLGKAARAGPRGKVFAWIDAQVALGPDSDPRAMASWVAVSAQALRDPVVREVFRQTIERSRAVLEKLVREALAAEGRASRSARVLSAAILAAVQGAFQLGCTSPGVIPPGSMASSLRAMAGGLIAAEPEV